MLKPSLACSVALLVAFAAAPRADAQQYPARAITLFVPYAPGGSIDSLGRMIAQKLSERLGKPVVVENRPGAGTVLAAAALAKAEPDGHTLLITPSTLAVNATLYKKLPYDPAKDFAPVALVADIPLILVVNAALPVNSVSDLVALAKQKPGQLSYASSGPGSTFHLAAELFKTMTATDMTHVPYKGGPPAMTDLVAGHVQIMFADPGSALPQIRQGRVKALGITSLERVSWAADIVPIADAGVPGFSAVPWNMVVAPAGTPKPVLDRLNAELNSITTLPDVLARAAEIGVVPKTSPPPDVLQGFLWDEITRWGQVVREAGVAESE